jgi:VCBS repeat-containing protein
MTVAWLFLSILTECFFESGKAYAAWLDSAWSQRATVTVFNPGGSEVTDFQVYLSLDSTFDFDTANSDGSDVRFTTGDGTTLIPYWIESWNADSRMASIWMKVPAIPPSGTTIYLYYGNRSAAGASDGAQVFEFFDEFESGNTTLGYYNLGAEETVLVQDQGWEDSAPHTLSVAQNNSGGYTYWGYYGLQSGCGGIGLSFSDDLVHWTKYSGNPLFVNGRWPSVLKVGDIFYMLYTVDFCATSYIELAVSSDGVNFSDLKTIKAAEPGYANQNPDLFYNSDDGKYYIYWYRGDDRSFWEIRARSAATPEGLDDPSSETVVLRSSNVLAAPHMLFIDGTYFLSTESLDSVGQWITPIYSSSSPTSGFSLLPGNPVLTDGSACNFQHLVGTQLHNYYCKLTESTWTLNHRVADLIEGRLEFHEQGLDPSKWTASGGSWTIVTDVQRDGSLGGVLENIIGTDSWLEVLLSSYQGRDYVLEAHGKLLGGRVWGLGVQAADSNNLCSVNLYEDLDSVDNLYVYSWLNGQLPANTLAQAAVGGVGLDTWYKLSAKVHGDSIDIYKDNELMVQASSSRYATGAIALYGERNTVAQYDNVLVRKYATVEPFATLASGTTPSLVAVTLNPSSVVGGSTSEGTVTLSAPAPGGGATVTLWSSMSSIATVPPNVIVPGGQTNANFTVTTSPVASITALSISASWDEVTKSSVFSVLPGSSNLPPVAVNDAYSTSENTPLSVEASGVLDNDTDPEGDPLTAQLVTGPSYGTFTLNADGSFAYTPGTDYVGSDSFTYQASDGTLTSNTATVTITITSANAPPVATNDMYNTSANTPLSVPAPGVLDNDTDPEGSPLTAQLATGPSYGTLTLNTDGSFIYTPSVGYGGSDSFTYQADDGIAVSNIATVTINVGAPGHEVVEWKGNKAGAVSLTFDDGYESHYSIGVAALNEFGLKGTFFLITEATSVGWPYFVSWDSWRTAAVMGHEIGSHTKTHPNLTTLSMAGMRDEILGSKTEIDNQISSQDSLVFAYPYGILSNNVKTTTGSAYIAARGVRWGLNSAPFDFTNLYAVFPDTADAVGKSLESQIDLAETSGQWLVIGFHGLDGTGYGPVTEERFRQFIEYMTTKNVWVGTLSAVVKYIRERDSANLSVLFSVGEELVLDLTDGLDDAIYNEALTIRSEVPATCASALVEQGDTFTTVSSVLEGTTQVIYYNAVPDRGEITILCNPASSPQ